MGFGRLGVRDGATRADAPVREHRYPQWLFVVLSLGTILLLLLQLTVGLRQSDRMYPVTAYAMFSGTFDGSIIEYRLEGTTSDGHTQSLQPEEFGLTELQLRANLSREVVRPAVNDDPEGASARLEKIADIWSDRQARELADVTLWRMDRWLDGREAQSTQVASWER